MDFHKKVWAPDVHDGYVLGRIVDIGAQNASVQPANSKKVVSVPYESVYPAEDDDRKDVDDNCALMFLNEGTLLNNVRLRYARDQIYTYVANILIALNPYFNIQDLYSASTIKKYQGKSLGVIPPHIFAIADKAYRDMKRLKESQSIVVSGESGAGKTESQKHILRYLCESWGSHAGPIEKQILQFNPILEAFGNAKTLRNNNSSRFGKFVEIHFAGKNYHVAGGYVSHYLLEKSRLCHQQKDERNYHIFYQLCGGTPPPLKKKLFLTSPDQFNYLRYGCTQYFCSEHSQRQLDPSCIAQKHRGGACLRDAVVDDVADFSRLDSALAQLGMDEQTRTGVYAIVAGLLHLGNIMFGEDPEDTRGGCCIVAESANSLGIAATLLGVDKDELHIGLTCRVMQAARGGAMGTVIRVPLKSHESVSARDALAKAIYSKLFDYIVKKINQCIPLNTSDFYIGVLDIAGFEYFTVNSFEQFCINYCNEKLQQFFNDRILRQEQEIYEAEGLGVRKIEYVDNQDCIELIEAKPDGIIDLLDEESKLPRCNHQHFTSSVHQRHKGHFRLAVPRKSKLREHRDIREDEGFLIRHYAGAVCYQTALFLEKNNDALHASLEFLVEDSKFPLLRKIFEKETKDEKKGKQGKLGFVSVGAKFRNQLNILMQKLDSTGTHFVRCIKPNSNMVRHQFEGGQILSQLQCSGMNSVLELMQQGYPSRTQFAELYKMYKQFMPPDLARLDPRLFCKCLFKALGLNQNDYKFGLTKVFFRPGKFSEFDQMLRSDPENLAQLVKKVKQWLIRTRWKKAIWGTLMVIKLKNKILWRRAKHVRIQSAFRGHLARKKYRPKIQALSKVRSLNKQMSLMHETVNGLRDENRMSWANHVNALQLNIDSLADRIKRTNISTVDMEREYATLLHATETKLEELRKQSNSDKQREEQERIKKMQQEMEMEKQRKIQEEQEIKLHEEAKRRKTEIEKQRKEEEVAKNLIDEREAVIVEQQKKVWAAAEKQRLQAIEQERRDHELALRLAAESNGAVEELQLPPKIPTPGETKATGQYDLTKKSYAELRDAINTSNDIELLQACRAEFHRRLKAYHEWKEKNKGKQNAEQQRAPDYVVNNTMSLTQNNVNVPSRAQRFFRIPFSGPNDRFRDTQGNAVPERAGLWYAHFDGAWIVRQMEIHPNKVPILLVGGRDDMQMCELSLDNTGLTRKRGAEILAHEFEAEWRKHGGPLFNPAIHKHIQPQRKQ